MDAYMTHGLTALVATISHSACAAKCKTIAKYMANGVSWFASNTSSLVEFLGHIVRTTSKQEQLKTWACGGRTLKPSMNKLCVIADVPSLKATSSQSYELASPSWYI